MYEEYCKKSKTFYSYIFLQASWENREQLLQAETQKKDKLVKELQLEIKALNEQMKKVCATIVQLYTCKNSVNKDLTLSALQTRTNTIANSVGPNETTCNKPSHQDLHCDSVFDCRLKLKPLFASLDMSNFKDRRVHFTFSGLKGINQKVK